MSAACARRLGTINMLHMYAVAAPLFLLLLLFFISLDYAHNASVCHTLFRNIYKEYTIHIHVCVRVMLESVSCVGFVIHRIRRQLIEQRVKLESDMLMCYIECAMGAGRRGANL